MEARLRNIALEVRQRIQADSPLTKLMQDYGEARWRVEQLNGEIEGSPEADKIGEILQELQATVNPAVAKATPIYVSFMGNRINVRPVIDRISETVAISVKILK